MSREELLGSRGAQAGQCGCLLSRTQSWHCFQNALLSSRACILPNKASTFGRLHEDSAKFLKCFKILQKCGSITLPKLYAAGGVFISMDHWFHNLVHIFRPAPPLGDVLIIQEGLSPTLDPRKYMFPATPKDLVHNLSKVKTRMDLRSDLRFRIVEWLCFDLFRYTLWVCLCLCSLTHSIVHNMKSLAFHALFAPLFFFLWTFCKDALKEMQAFCL